MENIKQSLIDLERAINTLGEKKNNLVSEKKENEMKNTILKNKIRTGINIPTKEYKKICDDQNNIMKNQVKIEKEMSTLSIEIRRKSLLHQELKNELKKDTKIDIKNDLTQMRDYYINYSADRSRVSSMRACAAEFSEKLQVIINKLG